jgi:hypothetical protein
MRMTTTSSRAKSRDPMALSFGFAAGFFDFASLRMTVRSASS